MKMKKVCSILLIMCFVIGFGPLFKCDLAIGESKSQDDSADPSPKKEAKPKQTITALVTIIHSAKDLKEQLEVKKKEDKTVQTEEQKAKVKDEIKELNEKLGSYAKDFEKIATGVDLETFEEKPEEEFDWKKEIQRILGPIVQQLRGITERPRQIEKLRMELARHESRIIPVKKAVEHIEKLIIQAKDDKTKKEFEEKLRKEMAATLKKEIGEKLTLESQQALRKELQEKFNNELAQVLKKIPDETARNKLAQKLKKESQDRINKEIAQHLASEKFKKELAQILKSKLENTLKSEAVIKELGNRLGQELGALAKELESLQTSWKNEEQQITSQHDVTKYQLEEKLKQRTSIFVSIQNVLRMFFKSRGKNFLFALLAFFVVFLLLRFFHRLIYRFSPIHHRESRSFYVRLGDVIYHIMTVIGTVGAFLITLYIVGDWVLLILTLIFLLGISWTAKKGLPLFWEQIKLLLNLSAVRENERVVYNGIPWRVVSLNIYTHLENPNLKTGRTRLPIRDLVGLRSRPYHKDEPWFPCQENDWVILGDGTLGKVVSQSPEIVQLVLRGGAHKTYLTQNFLGLNPTNISTNFRLKVTFGIDYAHQRLSTQEIPDKLRQMLILRLDEEGCGDNVINLDVELKEAGASSLDLEIIADFSGQIADAYDNLGRALPRIAVEACNKYGWVIPFKQITIHTAGSIAP